MSNREPASPSPESAGDRVKRFGDKASDLKREPPKKPPAKPAPKKGK